MHAARRRRCDLRRSRPVDHAVPVVRPREHEVCAFELAHGVEQELDPLPGRDAAHVEDERCVLRDPELAPQPSVSGRLERFGKAATAHPNALAGHPRAEHVLALDARGDDDRSRSLRHAPGDGRVEDPLEAHLAQARLEHAERLEDIRDAPGPRPGGDAGRDHVPEAEDVHDVRTPEALQLQRQAGRDAHPAVAKRRRQVPHPHVLDRVRPRAARARVVEVEERRRQHLDLVAAPGQALAQLAPDPDRTAEGDGRPPGRAGEDDPQLPLGSVHGTA